MAKRKALARGLDALLSAGSDLGDAGGSDENADGDSLKYLPVEKIRRGPWQPRKHIDPDRLEELADSIKARGIVQPIVVKQAADGIYEIIAGERRWRAAQVAGLDEVPALVRDVPDSTALAIALIENIQREDLNPVEEARAICRLIDEHDMTHQAVADSIGRSRSAVSNLLRLLELSEPVLSRLETGELEMGHARALRGLAVDMQLQAALEVISRDLSARQTEALVRRLKRDPDAEESVPTASARDPNIARLEQTLSERLGTSVAVKVRAKGRGELVIRYESLEQFDGLLEQLVGKL
ncbi:MAG: ParB/RepB/Spo0J family partition protein [Gammaproteobacteria bacterium]|nr:ParB/RepB/Spo0J family partition protein [Gammaproteobacteria bacterium]